tara:strand:+ start:166 stop:333 length:168 start_codon:yes stop_codon:yes gene_type:complete
MYPSHRHTATKNRRLDTAPTRKQFFNDEELKLPTMNASPDKGDTPSFIFLQNPEF